ncbi:MAG: hypothetical protein AB7S81_03540, partial [Bdellovibrionales bacterium]
MVPSEELAPISKDLYAYIFEKKTDRTGLPLAPSLYELARIAAENKSDFGETRTHPVLYQALHKVWSHKTTNRKLSLPVLSILRKTIEAGIEETSNTPQAELQHFYKIYRNTLLNSFPDDGSLVWLLTMKPLGSSGRTFAQNSKMFAAHMIKAAKGQMSKTEKDNLRNALAAGLAIPSSQCFQPLSSTEVDAITSFVQENDHGISVQERNKLCQEIRARAKELRESAPSGPTQEDLFLKHLMLARCPTIPLPFYITLKNQQDRDKILTYGDVILGQDSPFSDLDDLYKYMKQAERLCRIPSCIKKEALQEICTTHDHIPNNLQHRIVLEALGLKTKYQHPYKPLKERLNVVRKEKANSITIMSTDIDPRFCELYAYLFEDNMEEASFSLIPSTESLVERMEFFEDGEGNKRTFSNLRHALYQAWNPNSTAGLSNSLFVLLRRTVEALIQERAPHPEKERERFYKKYNQTIQNQTPDDGSLRWFLVNKTFGNHHEFLSNGISECAQMAVPDAEHYDLQKIRIGTRLPQHTSFRPLQEK